MEPIAIVGMACRLPGAPDLDAYWRLLRNGVDAIGEVPPERWDLAELYDASGAAPGKMATRWGGFLDRVDGFDPGFFGISPREAAYMDPQQRLLLEMAWEAMDDAGVVLDRWSGRPAGVFVGISTYDYGVLQMTSRQPIVDGYANTGNAFSIAANRISYLFDFRGPSVAVDTACSSSLTAVHLACQSLLVGESAMALAGGVNVILSPAITVGFSKLKMMAADGRCKTFDARADGYVRGEGAGMVVLKLLSHALRDGDRIHALIRGSAINQDGRTNGLTAPNGLSQEALIRHALDRAGVAARQIGYVEAHGTGTALGDPIEMNALGAALAGGRPAGSRCAVGSVKSNIGHLEAAAGIAGLIKVSLALAHREIPPSLHFQQPNPLIPFETLPLEVQRTLGPWPEDARPALAGISSFGFGGTNVHVVLEEPPARPPGPRAPGASPPPRSHLVPLSARSPEALQALAASWCALLQGHGRTVALADLAHTASRRRTHHEHRLAVVAHTREELHGHLQAHLAGEPRPGVAAGRAVRARRRKLALVFPGHGGHWLGMARGLLDREPVFQAALERCDQAVREHAEWSVLQELHADVSQSRLDAVHVTQPTVWAIQVALAALWRSWGVTPDAVVGHSMGEVAAAHVAGALGLDDAAKVICRRSALMHRTRGRGAMAAVELPLAEVEEVIAGHQDRVAVGAVNSPSSTVLSGDVAAIEEIERVLAGRQVLTRRVNTDVAFHSAQMEPLLPELREALGGLAPAVPALPLYSTVTGEKGAGLRLDAGYWERNLRQRVLFAPAIERLVQDGHLLFLELSPHPILLAPIQQTLRHLGKTGTVLPSLRRDTEEQAAMLGSLGTLFTLGYPVDWSGVSGDGGQITDLPLYPWQRERFWMEQQEVEAGLPRTPAGPTSLGAYVRSAVDGSHFWDVEAAEGTEAASLDIARAAVPHAFGPAPHQLEDVAFVEGTGAADTAGRVQVVLAPAVEGIASFRIFRWQGKEAVLHATGRVRLAEGEGAPESSPTVTPATIRAAPAAERSRLLEDYLQQKVARVLKMPAPRVDVNRPLTTFGIDSLMAVEVKNGVERELNVSVPLIQLIQGPTVAELAAALLAQIDGTLAPAPAATSGTPERGKALSPWVSVLSLGKDDGDA